MSLPGDIDTTTHVYKTEPIELVNPVKQGFFDYIITYVGDAATDPTALVEPTAILVRGDYGTLYNKLINNELILGCQVSVQCIDGTPMSQVVTGLSDMMAISIYKKPGLNTSVIPTIGGKPVLNINGAMLIDCNNNHYDPSNTSNIPFDEPLDPK